MAKTDQQLAQEELARQGVDYKFGGDTIAGSLIPMRREVLQPQQTQLIGYDDRGYGIYDTIPAQYGEAEFDVSYAPIVRGAREAGSFIKDFFFGDFEERSRATDQMLSAVRGVAEAIPQMVNEQAQAAAAGGIVYDPETNRLIEFDPTVAMIGGAPAGAQALRAATPNTVTLGSAGGRLLQDSRKARARESGFNPDQVMYHGTSSTFDEFQPSTVGDLGAGVYISPNPETAGGYAQMRRFMRRQTNNASPNVMPLYMRDNLNLLDLQGRSIMPFTDERIRELKERGYDGIRQFNEDGTVRQINVFDPANVRSVNAEFDPAQSGSSQILASGSRAGTGVAAGSAIDEALSIADSRLPPLENSQRTQLGASTLPSYEKAAGVLGNEGRALDFGAGRGQGAQAIGFDTFEPYPREGFSPTYTTAADIPDQSYDRLTSLNVLNVMPRNVRDQAVADIGRVLRPGGRAVVTTRGRDVLNAKGSPGDEPMSIITTADTYQKGFTQPELREYIQGQLGDEFTISNLPEKIGQAGVLIERTGGGTTLRSGSRAGTGIATGSAIRDVFRIGDEGFDARFDDRALEQDRIANTQLEYDVRPFVRPDVSIYDLEGRPFRLTMSDRTAAGRDITGVEGVQYDIPVNLQGGQDFMFANPLGREGQVWAQDKGATTKYLNSFLGLDGQPIGDEVLMLPFRMSPAGGDFATMTGEVMVTHARNNVPARAKRQADKTIREFYPSWKGIDNPESLQQISEMKGDPRKALINVLDRDLRNEGGLGIGQARLAVSDRSQYNALDTGLQNVGIATPNIISVNRRGRPTLERFENSGHRTYEQGLAGRPMGTLIQQDISAYELLPDYLVGRGFRNFEDLMSSDPGVLANEAFTLRRGTRGGIITEDILRDIERRRAQ